MNNTEILAIEEKFFILAEGVETPESIYPQESASDYFKSVWQKQNEIARQAFKKIVKDSSHRPHVCDAIVQTIADLNNPDFDDFCFDVSQKNYCPETVNMIIENCLILRNNHKSILKIDKTIRDGCQLFLNNKLNEGDICHLVHLAAILERNHLSHEILNMVQSVNANNFPYIHITLLKPVEIIAHGMAENGDIYLRTILEDNSSYDYEQAAAVFGLACKRQLSLFNYFQELFWRFYKQRSKTDVCRQLIEAIVYTTSFYDNYRFLQDSLPIVRKDIEKHSAFLSFFRRRHY
ncbi:MAG: hypothetical protein Q4P17_11540, partial [Methanobacterium sp.]|nr:hypothetical protein [Methanobacterium sp.]